MLVFVQESTVGGAASRKPATVFDVARESGVSTATVSRVFTGKTDRVAPGTLERVRDAAPELRHELCCVE